MATRPYARTTSKPMRTTSSPTTATRAKWSILRWSTRGKMASAHKQTQSVLPQPNAYEIKPAA